MGYVGRITTFFLVLCINLIYMIYYYIVDGHVETIEIIGLPIMLMLAWWFGKQFDKAKYYAEKDVLTDMYNRRLAIQLFPKMLAMVKRKKEKLSLLVVDVDRFKEINDTYGHAMGDRVLRRISFILNDTTRESDMVVRWGGDEFIILAPYTDKDASLCLIKRIEARLITISCELGIPVSTSIGIAVFPDHGKNMDELIKRADQKMYSYKKKDLVRYGG